ncbi:MAG: Crp/Fnr family transcriptional regulator [Bacteroidetes bacterium]|nr:Crp/Fnr family transcriptional regulator [Bacteroidota bacterium]
MNTKDERVKNINSKNSVFWELFFPKYCSSEWIPLINLYKRNQSFKVGERIFNEGDVMDGVYLLISGKAKVVSRYDKNNERILRLAAEGKMLGHRAMAHPNFTVSAVALTECTTIFIPIEIFLKLIKANPEFGMFMINFFATELHESEERMKNMIHHDVKLRVADIIIMLVDAFGYHETEKTKLSFTLCRKDIANIAGTTYETAIRSLFQLQEMNLIELDKKTILVKKEAELRELASQKS